MSKSAVELLEALCDEFWEWRCKEYPEFASFCGVAEYNDRLNDHSVQAFNRRVVDSEKFISKCKDVETLGNLSEEEQSVVGQLKQDLVFFIEGVKQEGYVFPISYGEGMHVDFEMLIGWTHFNELNDYKMYLERLKAIPTRLSQDEELMRHGVKIGKTLHSSSLGGVAESFKALDTPLESSLFYQPFRNFNTPKSVKDDDLYPMKVEAKRVIVDQVLPAFKKLGQYVTEEYTKRCRAKEGVHCMADGSSFYKQCLKFHLSIDMDPQEVHDLGKREVDRIKKQMDEVIKKLDFKGDFKEFVKDLRSNPKFYFDTKEALLQSYKDLCNNQIRPQLPKLFKQIPDSKLTIEPAPESRPDAPVGFYLAGTLDGSRPGIYYVNLSKLNSCPKYEAMTLSLHEGEPGHHFQGMYAIEDKTMPKFVQYTEDMYYNIAPSRFPLHTAYMEGWGLYCEYLGNELGLYEDPYDLFGHLSFEMHRALRLMVDTGLHCLGWTFEEAVQPFLDYTAISETFARNEIKRYITWPGQACAYKIGQIKIKELREKAATEMGDKFDIKEFHEVVLKCGPSPLTKLETLVNKYIQSAKS